MCSCDIRLPDLVIYLTEYPDREEVSRLIESLEELELTVLEIKSYRARLIVTGENLYLLQTRRSLPEPELLRNHCNCIGTYQFEFREECEEQRFYP